MAIVNYRKKSALVRVVAEKLPEEKAKKSRKRKKANASKKQHKITEDTLFCTGWIVVITSLGVDYCGEEILYLYKSRWQVELLLKRFKQNFIIITIKAGSTSYAEDEVLLWLIIWTMTERQAFLAGCYFSKKEDRTEIYSIYEKYKIMFLQRKEILYLSWTLFADLSNAKYIHYLSKKKRWCNNQNDEFRFSEFKR